MNNSTFNQQKIQQATNKTSVDIMGEVEMAAAAANQATSHRLPIHHHSYYYAIEPFVIIITLMPCSRIYVAL